MSIETPVSTAPIERQQLEVDIACVGFGPAMGGFLTTLSRHLLNPDGTTKFESPSLPGSPLQVVCYERAEGLGFGDVKLMAMIGAFLGVKLTVLTIFAASLTGSFFGLFTVLVVWMKRTHRFMRRLADAAAARRRAWQSAQLVYRNYQMPFGVFLGSMSVLAFFFGDRLLRWYGRLW